MITPRRTRLIRVPDLRTFQATLTALSCDGELSAVRDRAVLVPSRPAASQLRRTFETRYLTDGGAAGAARRGVIVLPDVLPRTDLYARLHERADVAPAWITDFEREVILRAAAREAGAAGAPAPFSLRPGLIREILEFYDQLRRQHQQVESFERLLVGDLGASAATDRGADRLLQQTRFLAYAFRAYETRLEAEGLVDEHRLRALLLVQPAARPLRHLIVAAGDAVCERGGLWPTDFDLIARLPLLETIDVLATEAWLAAGYHERLQQQLPGIEDVRAAAADGPSTPTLLVPATPPPQEGPGTAAPGRPYFVHRDREEELASIVRLLKAESVQGTASRHAPAMTPAASDRTAIIFQRPLPYLYVARQIFGAAGVPFEALDTLPLAAEPYAAALDLIFSFVAAEFGRSATVALLSSPLLRFEVDGQRVGRAQVAALDRRLVEARYLGGADRLQALGDADPDAPHGRAARAAAAAARELSSLLEAAAATAHLDALLSFLARHEEPPPPVPLRERHLRARAAVLGAIGALGDAHRRHDDPQVTFSEVAATIRRWIEGQTFAPRAGAGGVQLLDAAAARYGDFDAAWIVGVVEGEWPGGQRRSIFYPAALLSQFGWTKDHDRLRATRAAFDDLLRLPRRTVAASTFTLEEDAIVNPSSLLEDLAEAGLQMESLGPCRVRVFTHEALAADPVVQTALSAGVRTWLSARIARGAATEARYHGVTGGSPAHTVSVSAIERYLECPFKYFAAHVLRLPERMVDEPLMGPLRRGRFVHEVFQQFFTEWQARGHGAITLDSLDEANLVFHAVAEPLIAELPESDRALERTRLLGSAASPGLGDRVFRVEAERSEPVVERLLEYDLSGEFVISDGDRSRTLRIRGIADRIDLLTDGSFRLLDYKLGKAPRPSRAVQLPVYSACASHRLEGYRGRHWILREAGYVPLRGPQPFVPLASHGDLAAALADGQRRCLDALDRIERGDFPPQPEDTFLCGYCSYAAVCRKDYVEGA